MDSISGISVKKLLNEGKTKQIWELSNTEVLVVSKDRITMGDGLRAHNMVDKSVISTKTTSNVFEILNNAGIKTAFVKQQDPKSFVATRCEMVPIEWVARRIATGSFLKRYSGVEEGTRFYPLKMETFYKDDANHDPQWVDEQILAADFKLNGLEIGPVELDMMKETTLVVFEVLEKYWAAQSCALVDMKIEFGISSTGSILVADVIDNDSWRLWPHGDKRLMKDKQVYRLLTEVKESDMIVIKENYEWVAARTDAFKNVSNDHLLVVIIMGSKSDESFCKKIGSYCEDLSLPYVMRISSAHKTTKDVLKIIAQYDGCGKNVVYIAVAGRSNGLGPVIAANTVSPVINCPPTSSGNDTSRDIWSSLSLPSGMGCGTVLYPEAAALFAGHIFSSLSCKLWSRMKAKQLETAINLNRADQSLNS